MNSLHKSYEERFCPSDLKQQSYNVNHYINMDDHNLWDHLRTGEESVFICIYKKYFNILVSYGLQFFKDTIDAEDFVQDLFIDLRAKRAKLPPLRNSIKVYLFISLRNKILDFKRKEFVRNKNLKNYFEEFEFAVPVEEELIQTQEYADKVENLNKALSGLTSRQREAIYYLYYENLSYIEIREIMKLDHVRSARNLIYKAFNSLRTIIKSVISFLLFSQLF